MNAMKVGWYVIYTRPRHEKKVAEQLENMRIDHFLPKMRTLKIFSGRKKYVVLPIFPSYIFVKLETMRHYFESLEIPGVLHYVRTGNQIAGIGETVIEKLRAIVSSNSQNFEVSVEHFNLGSITSINTGPFTGFSCEVIHHKGKQKVLVRIELLQRNILIDLPVDCLTPVSLAYRY